MRRQWDQDLSELCGGSTDPDAGKLANRIEQTVLGYERALEAISYHADNQDMSHVDYRVKAAECARAALSKATGKE